MHPAVARLRVQRHAGTLRLRGGPLRHVAQRVGQRYRREPQPQRAGLDGGEVEQVVDERAQVLARRPDVARPLQLQHVGGRGVVLDELGEAEHRVQRRAQLVADTRQQLRLGTARALGRELVAQGLLGALVLRDELGHVEQHADHRVAPGQRFAARPRHQPAQRAVLPHGAELRLEHAVAARHGPLPHGPDCGLVVDVHHAVQPVLVGGRRRALGKAVEAKHLPVPLDREAVQVHAPHPQACRFGHHLEPAYQTKGAVALAGHSRLIDQSGAQVDRLRAGLGFVGRRGQGLHPDEPAVARCHGVPFDTVGTEHTAQHTRIDQLAAQGLGQGLRQGLRQQRRRARPISPGLGRSVEREVGGVRASPQPHCRAGRRQPDAIHRQRPLGSSAPALWHQYRPIAASVKGRARPGTARAAAVAGFRPARRGWRTSS